MAPPWTRGIRYELEKRQAEHINGRQTGCVWPGAREALAHNGPPSFSQSQDWKYQCGTREALPSAQCTALLEANVVPRRVVNLYALSVRDTSTALCLNQTAFMAVKYLCKLYVLGEKHQFMYFVCVSPCK